MKYSNTETVSLKQLQYTYLSSVMNTLQYDDCKSVIGGLQYDKC